MLYRQIQIFLEVANCLNFTRAAENLYMTQQAVTKQIAALEKEIGVSLFYRTTRTVSLTETGQILRDDFTDINRRIESSMEKVRGLEKGKRKSMAIGFLNCLSREDYIVPIMEMLDKEFPDYFFDMHLLDFVELRNEMHDNVLDLCITASNDWMLWRDTRARVLRDMPYKVVFSRKLPIAMKQHFSIEDLKEYDQIVLPDKILVSGATDWARKIPCRVLIHAPDVTTMLVRTESGQGFSIMPRTFEGYNSEKLTFRSLPYTDAKAQVACICKQNADERIQTVVNLIADKYNKKNKRNKETEEV
jgi:DNA-binding transcriptional LysR family regulator